MAVTVFRTSYKRKGQQKLFCTEIRKTSLTGILEERWNCNFLYMRYCKTNDDFVKVFMNIFDKHAPIKKKVIGINQGPFINNAI